jgi:hypothetical protein
MTALMAERIRLIIDTDDVVRRAVHLRRIKTPGTPSNSDVVNAILREALAEEIAEVEGYDKSGGEKPRRKKGKGSGEGD